jgi:HTH-type transcriptional regulator, sugar sensing transcriptional regulator
MQRVIDRAQLSLFAALWETEAAQMAPNLIGAQQRGIEVHLAVYGAMPASLGGYDLTLCGASAEERLSGRRLSAVVGDSKESVTTVFQPRGTITTIWTENIVLALLATEYIRAMLKAEDDVNRRNIPGRITSET